MANCRNVNVANARVPANTWVRALLQRLRGPAFSPSLRNRFSFTACSPNLHCVKVKNLLLFPKALAEARRNAGLSQKALALSTGLNQSYLCGVERGRRGTPRQELVDSIARALCLREASPERAGLAWAAVHDRVLSDLELRGVAEAGPLISASLHAVRILAKPELDGLLADMSRAIESRSYLDRLGSVAPRQERGEVSM